MTAGYHTLIDYKFLLELMKKEAVICLFNNHGFQEVAFARIRDSASGKIYSLTHSFPDCYSEEEFIDQCLKREVEFLEPSKAFIKELQERLLN